MSVDAQLSIAILVRNAEDSIEETLASVATIADELVVLDTGSTDHTLSIAGKYTDRLFQQAWDDDFSAARNYLKEQCQGKWILWLDAGEVLKPGEAEALKKFVSEEADPQAAYALLVHVPRAPQNISSEQAARIRLIPNRSEIVFEGAVREQVRPSLESVRLRVEGLPWRIYRGQREHRPEVQLRKARRNLQIAESEVAAGNLSASLLNCIAEARHLLDDSEGAAQTYQQALDASKRGSADMLEAYYGLLTSLSSDDEKHQMQLAVCLEALEEFPLDTQLLCAMGGYLQAQNRLDLAVRSYLTAFQYGRVSPEIWHLESINEIAATSCSRALEMEGKIDEALEVLQEAMTQSLNTDRVPRGLIDLLIQKNDLQGGYELLAAIDCSDQERVLLRAAVRGACLAQEQNWIAACGHLGTSYDAGCRDPLCLRWYGAVLMAMGEREKAREVFTKWVEMDPLETEPRQFLSLLDSAQSQGEESQPQVRVDAGVANTLPGPVAPIGISPTVTDLPSS